MLSFLKRNLKVLIAALTISLIVSFYWSSQQEASFHTTIFTTIANQSESSTQENEQASTYFGETLMGWFRNPAFLDKIYSQANAQGSLSAHKQERQNLIIEIDADSEANSEALAGAAFSVLQTEIEQFNQDTENKYQLLDLGMTTYQNPLKQAVFILAAIFAVLFFTFFAILGFEAITGRISLPAQINGILGGTEVLTVNINKQADIDYLATSILKTNKPIFFAGADFDHSDFTVNVSQKASEIDKNVILIDGDLKEKKLHQNLGLSEMMKNLKGLTDRIKKEEQLSQFVHKSLDGNLNFLAAGNGTLVILEDLAEQLNQHKTILIHTTLPQNFPLLSMEDYTLFLFVKMGKTKLKTLEQIKTLGVKDLKVFVV